MSKASILRNLSDPDIEAMHHKLRRDAEIGALGPIGSGYPSDPVTRAHLLSLMQSGDPLPPYVRTRWGTLDKLRQGGLF